MPSLAMAFPLLPGKAQEAENFTREMRQHSELEEGQRRLGITRENWYLQQTPQGDMVIVYWEAEDPLDVLEKLATADSDYDRWAKQRMKEISGIDMDEPDTGTSLKMIFDWSA